MEQRWITEEAVQNFEAYLRWEEKSPVTIEKYLSDVRRFKVYCAGRAVTKELMLAYKQDLLKRYAVRSVNSKLASLNCLFAFQGWMDCKVKNLRLQHQTFLPEEKELSKAEYLRLLSAAQKNQRLYLIIQTICGTGIRVSELQYFTVEAVRTGTVIVRCKSKTRNVFVPGKLKKLLLNYAKKNEITAGVLFRTRTGRPVDRCNIWAGMKKLCASAQVNPKKVFPHNLRKLFARTFYGIEKDIAKLADILGHSSINTTRIYIMTTGVEHRQKIECLGLVL